MANLLPEDKATRQLQRAIENYSHAVSAFHANPSRDRSARLRACADAYSKVSAAQWEFEQVTAERVRTSAGM
ncbi:MAG TPA: hypothetical protein VF681_05800 [Abditibacteriaceae bacterium]|jgi:hypothetical protein